MLEAQSIDDKDLAMKLALKEVGHSGPDKKGGRPKEWEENIWEQWSWCPKSASYRSWEGKPKLKEGSTDETNVRC